MSSSRRPTDDEIETEIAVLGRAAGAAWANGHVDSAQRFLAQIDILEWVLGVDTEPDHE